MSATAALPTWLADPLDALVAMRPCPATGATGSAGDVGNSTGSCDQYPELLFVGTCVAACVAFRQSPFFASGSALNLVLSFPAAYYLFGFSGSSAAVLFLGDGAAAVVPPMRLQLLYLAVWVVFMVLLGDAAVRSFRRSVGLSGFVEFLAALDTAATTYNMVHIARAEGLNLVACLVAGALVGSAGFFIRNLLIAPEGSLNLASLGRRLRGVLALQLFCAAVYYACPPGVDTGGLAFLALTLANAGVHSFLPDAVTWEKPLQRRLEAALGKLLWP